MYRPKVTNHEKNYNSVGFMIIKGI